MGEWGQGVEIGGIRPVASEDGAGVGAGTQSAERA